MINPLIRYELEMANREQEQLRRRAALWDLARRTHTGRTPSPRPRWLTAVLAFLFTRSVTLAR
jgi:hypothetical protein